MNEKENKISEKTKNYNKMNLLNDENLYRLCKRYGEMTLKWRRKFTGLLPEVFKRKLHEKKGFSSIFEFAKKLTGMSEEQVRLVLNLEKRFEKMPMLKELLVDGKVSVNKLARVVSIAKPENEEFLANQLKLLPNRAVETLVRDIKFEENNGTDFDKQNGLFEPKANRKSLHVQTLNLSEEVQEKLLELQQKGIDLNELILEFLNKRNLEIEKQKTEIAKEIEIKNNAGTRKGQSSKTTKISTNHQSQIITTTQTTISRYIPVKIKKILHQEHGTKCSISNCTRPATNLHHTQRFSLSKNHDPNFIAPLCREHHIIAHTIDMNFNRKRFTANIT